MKTAFILFVACIIGLATSEPCSSRDPTTVARECGHLTCASNWHLTCDNRVCTCVENSPDNSPCASKSDCDALTGWNCDANRRHCIDGRCRCFRH